MNFENQMDIFDYLKRPVTITKPIRLIELFAGYGSQAMALKKINAKFEHSKVVEFDKYAIKSYNAVHGTNFTPMDITKIHGTDLNICNTMDFTYLLTYSFPCTDLSLAGKQLGMSKGSNTRSGLLWEVERILTEIQDGKGELPQILFMENVPQVHNKKNLKDFEKWIYFLEELGYTNYWQDLNTKDYGVAQSRNRCFMFSFLGEYNYCFPPAIPLNKKLKDYLENNVAEKYYINNEKAEKLIKQLINNGTLAQKKLKMEQICIDGTINNPQQKNIANCISARYDCGISNYQKVGNLVIKQIKVIGKLYSYGGNYPRQIYSTEHLSPTLTTMQGGNTQPMIVAMRGRNPDNPSERKAGLPTEQRLEINSKGISNCLTSVQKDNLVLEKEQQYRIRKLTPRKCGRLMGVSDEDISKMEKVNSNTQLYKQFGNSIVVDVMCAMFKNLNIKQD